MGIKGRGRSGRSRDSNPACQCCSSAHLVQCEPDEASSFTNPNVGPGTYASLRLKLDAWSSAVQRGQKCSSPTRRLPSRSWGPIRPRVCSWFRAPIRHECQTAQLKSRGARPFLSSSWVAFGRPPYLWTVLPGVPRHWRFPPASGGHPPRLIPPSGGLGLLPGAPKRGMPTGPKVFLALPDACGFRPCDRAHLKNGLVPYSCVGGTQR